jgi:hypothetical protein
MFYLFFREVFNFFVACLYFPLLGRGTEGEAYGLLSIGINPKAFCCFNACNFNSFKCS